MYYIVIYDRNSQAQCCGCTACESICPRKCITMQKDEDGFLYPHIDQEKCISCGLCKKVCMIHTEKDSSKLHQAYVAINTDSKIRMQSSSGGVFSLLAQDILAQNGIVVGAVFSDDYRSVKHCVAHNLDELYRMYGSKYMQSDMQGIYILVEDALKSGRKVLFTGTPCQVNGLRLFLGKEYDNLLAVDIICHGVPSSHLWDKYITSIEAKYHASVINVNFRSKQYSWKEFGINRIDANTRELFILKDLDPYMQMFIRNYCLRPSCYQCLAKGTRYSDITIGDFWGVENIFPDMNDGKGTSALIVRTQKGSHIVSRISQQLVLRTVDYSEVIRNNPMESVSVAKPEERETFFKDMNTESFSKIKKKYLKCPRKLMLRNLLIKWGIWKYIRPNSRLRYASDNDWYHLTFLLSKYKENEDMQEIRCHKGVRNVE